MKVYQLSLLVVAMVGGSQAYAAESLPSDATLAAMGLANLQVMSDSEGLAVRGMGYTGASAFGYGFAGVSSHGASAGSKNGYTAKGKHLAKGQNESYAGVEVEVEQGGHGGGYNSKSSKGGSHGGGHGGSKPKSYSINAFSGGSSIGIRK